MSERYWITGVQLGLLQSDDVDWITKQELINKVIDKQFIGNKRNYVKQKIKPRGDAMKFFKATKSLWVSKK